METIQKSIIQISKRDIKVKGDSLIIDYKGKEYLFTFKKISKRLAKAPQEVRENFILSPSGYGIHWPDADEDLSVGDLLSSVLK